jgi:hypothetical protein
MPGYVINDVVLGGVTLVQVGSAEFNPQEKRSRSAAAGASAASLYPLEESRPMANFETRAIATVLAGLPVGTGLLVSAGTITIPCRKRASGGTYASGSNHFTLSGANGFGVVTQIVARQGQPAVATVEFHFLSTDGHTAPYAENASQSVSSGTFTSEFSLGPVVLNSTALDDVESVTIRPGTEVETHLVNGEIYPRYATLKTPFEPVIEVACRDLDRAPAAITTLAAYLRKRASGGHVAGGTGEHCSFSFAAGVTEIRSISVDSEGHGSKVFAFHGTTLTTAVNATIA